MTPSALASEIRPNLDTATFSFGWLRAELERIEPGASQKAWDVLDHLHRGWSRLGWRIVALENAMSRNGSERSTDGH